MQPGRAMGGCIEIHEKVVTPQKKKSKLKMEFMRFSVRISIDIDLRSIDFPTGFQFKSSYFQLTFLLILQEEYIRITNG